jgi:Uncharacterized conserved protein
MFQVKFPLDIFWLDTSRRVVEISADTPPCKTPAKQCPNYGGTKKAVTVAGIAGRLSPEIRHPAWRYD